MPLKGLVGLHQKLTHHLDELGNEPLKVQLKRKADEEIRTLDPLLGKEMLYH